MNNEEVYDLYSAPNIIQLSHHGESDGQGMQLIWEEEKCIRGLRRDTKCVIKHRNHDT